MNFEISASVKETKLRSLEQYNMKTVISRCLWLNGSLSFLQRFKLHFKRNFLFKDRGIRSAVEPRLTRTSQRDKKMVRVSEDSSEMIVLKRMKYGSRGKWSCLNSRGFEFTSSRLDDHLEVLYDVRRYKLLIYRRRIPTLSFCCLAYKFEVLQRRDFRMEG